MGMAVGGGVKRRSWRECETDMVARGGEIERETKCEFEVKKV